MIKYLNFVLTNGGVEYKAKHQKHHYWNNDFLIVEQYFAFVSLFDAIASKSTHDYQ